jgi:thiol-disulfide isomerase/thioredoxin
MRTIIFACLLCSLIQSYAQTQSLKIGDSVPDVEIKNVINHPTTSVNISDFKEKLVILDFWATWCTPCVASFPKLDSLQKKFKNEVQILPVTSEGKQKVTIFLQKMKLVKTLLPATATEDSILEKLFRHQVLPHYVWIKNGNVIAITGGEEVNEMNIRRIVENEKVIFNIKNDLKYQIRYSGDDVPTFMPSIEVKSKDETKLIRMPTSNLIFYSAITTYLEGLPMGYHSYHPDIFTARNISILALYRVALFENSAGALNRFPGGLITEINDTILYDKIDVGHLRLRGLPFNDWIRKNGYCYDIKVPPELTGQKFKIMLADLNRYFGALYGIEGLMEKRKAKYLALVRTTQEDKLASKGGPRKIEVDKFSIVIQNAYVDALIANLLQPLQKYPPVVNKTGYKEKIDMQFTCDISNLNALNKELQKYGLLLQEKEDVFDVPVIRIKKQENY